MKLNQLLAIEKSVRTNQKRVLTDLYRVVQKSSLLNGHIKIFQPREDGGDNFPPENVNVQKTVQSILADVSESSAKLLDVVSRKDFANMAATADVIVDGDVVIKGVPATHLLYLEKHLGELTTLFKALPTLDPAEEWAYDENSGKFRTSPVLTSRTKKVQKPIVLYDATEHHPAQTQMISEDVVIGDWRTVKQSGAVPEVLKTNLLSRLESF